MEITFTNDEVLNLQSDFYLLAKEDKKYLQEYLNRIMYDMICGMKNEDIFYTKGTYCHIVTLIEYAIWKSRAIFLLFAAKASEEAIDNMVLLLLNRYMDSIEGDKGFYGRFEEIIGIPEQDLRMLCHESFWDNVKNTLLFVRQDFPDFLEKSDDLKDFAEQNDCIVFEGELDEGNKKAIENVLNYIGVENDVESCICIVRKVYENLNEDCFVPAYRYIEGVLFRLYELEYFVLPLDADVNWLKYITEDSCYLKYKKIYKNLWDMERALKIFEMAEEYLKKEEYAEAAKCYKKAALLGNIDSQFEYAVSVYQGEGCEADALESAFWHWIAAGNGNEKSMMNLGVFYREGSGVKQSLSQMTYWYARSAERLQPDGIFNLGCSIKLGELVEKSEEIGTALMKSIKVLHNEKIKEFVQGIAREIIDALKDIVYNIPL